MRRGRALAAALAVGTLTLLAAGCSGGGGGPAASSGAAHGLADNAAESGGAAAKAGAVPNKASGTGHAASRPAVETRAVISTGHVTLVSKHLDRVRDDLHALMDRYGGIVSHENVTSDKHGHTVRGTMELRMPAAHFADTMEAFADIARVPHADSNTDDVTTQIIDLHARVKTERAAIATLRKFLRQTRDAPTMIQFETEISTRQANLESMLAQQRYLDDQTSMSTIEVTLQRPAHHHVAPAPPPTQQGFLPGLRGGWQAFTAAGAVALTVVGAVLPFAILALVVGLPVWLLVRRHPRGAER